jgi:periplasmic divalent cation tolerance protein
MSQLPDACEVVFTAPDHTWLRQFTDALLADRLCAAAHHFPAIAASFWWHGEIRHRREYRASVHTRRDLAATVVERIRREHPYDVPGVIVLPITTGNPDYLEWIVSEARADGV